MKYNILLYYTNKYKANNLTKSKSYKSKSYTY